VFIRNHEKRQYGTGSSFYKSIYWHLMKDGIRVKAGQHVQVGDIIGLADNCGPSVRRSWPLISRTPSTIRRFASMF
jgi:murein DD-endopeptidase MepM/ murein hydrolase activator NlpD